KSPELYSSQRVQGTDLSDGIVPFAPSESSAIRDKYCATPDRRHSSGRDRLVPPELIEKALPPRFHFWQPFRSEGNATLQLPVRIFFPRGQFSRVAAQRDRTRYFGGIFVLVGSKVGPKHPSPFR